MTAGVLDRPTILSDRLGLDGGGTLEALLGSALSEARGNDGTECPVCHARMSFARAREGCAPAGGAELGGAECGGCGSRLS